MHSKANKDFFNFLFLIGPHALLLCLLSHQAYLIVCLHHFEDVGYDFDTVTYQKDEYHVERDLGQHHFFLAQVAVGLSGDNGTVASRLTKIFGAIRGISASSTYA